MDKNTFPDDGRITEREAIKRFGLTPSLLALLPEPDLKFRGKRPPLRLHHLANIQKMLESEEAQPLLERAKAFRSAAEKGKETKLKKAVEKAIADITVDKLTFQYLVRASEEEERKRIALSPALVRFMETMNKIAPDDPTDPVFIGHVLMRVFKYVLHHLAHYNSDYYSRGIGPESHIYGFYRQAVYDKILEAYPELKLEVERRRLMGE